VNYTLVSHRLARVVEAGLVDGAASSYYSIYRPKQEVLLDEAHRLLSRQVLTTLANEADLEAYDRKVFFDMRGWDILKVLRTFKMLRSFVLRGRRRPASLRDYLLPDESLKEIPAQREKLEVILRYASRDFEPDRRYPEKQVNEILERFHEDSATLWRELVGYKILVREKVEYWKMI